MNSNWRNRPTKIDTVSSDVDYIVSIDEGGTGNLKAITKSRNKGTPIPEGEKHFCVCACVFRTSDYKTATEQVMNLKHHYWEDALYSYNGETKRVCFHSREIRNRKEAFHPSLIDYDSFMQDFSRLIEDIPMTIYASHIDKIAHADQYLYPDSPYELCMTFVLERIVRDMRFNQSCVVVLESRGEKEDAELLQQIKHLIDWGSQYTSASTFSKIKGVYFNPKWSEKDHCQKSYWCLEVADVCAYPVYKFFSYGKRDMAFDVIEKKFKGYPNYVGKGLKTFPKRKSRP